MKRLFGIGILTIGALALMPITPLAQEDGKEAEEAAKSATAKIWEYQETRVNADPENKQPWRASSANFSLKVDFGSDLGQAVEYAFADDFTISDGGKKNLFQTRFATQSADGLRWEGATPFGGKPEAGKLTSLIFINPPARKAESISLSGHIHVKSATEIENHEHKDTHEADVGETLFSDTDADVKIKYLGVAKNRVEFEVIGTRKNLLELKLFNSEGKQIYSSSTTKIVDGNYQLRYFVSDEEAKDFSLRFKVADKVTTTKFKVAIESYKLP